MRRLLATFAVRLVQTSVQCASTATINVFYTNAYRTALSVMSTLSLMAGVTFDHPSNAPPALAGKAFRLQIPFQR